MAVVLYIVGGLVFLLLLNEAVPLLVGHQYRRWLRRRGYPSTLEELNAVVAPPPGVADTTAVMEEAMKRLDRVQYPAGSELDELDALQAIAARLAGEETPDPALQDEMNRRSEKLWEATHQEIARSREDSKLMKTDEEEWHRRYRLKAQEEEEAGMRYPDSGIRHERGTQATWMAKVRAAVSRREAALVLLHQAAAGFAQRPLDFTQWGAEGITVNTDYIRESGKALYHDCILAAFDGDTARAAADIEAMLQIAAWQNAGPTMMDQWMRSDGLEEALHALEGSVLNWAPDATQLQRIERALSALEVRDAAERAYAGEVVLVSHTVEQILRRFKPKKKSKLDEFDLPSLERPDIFDWVRPINTFSMLWNLRRHRKYRRMVEALRLEGPARANALQRLLRTNRLMEWLRFHTDGLAALAGPGRVLAVILSIDYRMRVMRAVLRVERYRATHGELPANLSDLESEGACETGISYAREEPGYVVCDERGLTELRTVCPKNELIYLALDKFVTFRVDPFFARAS